MHVDVQVQEREIQKIIADIARNGKELQVYGEGGASTRLWPSVQCIRTVF